MKTGQPDQHQVGPLLPWPSLLLAVALLALNAFIGWAVWVWAVLPLGSTLFLGLGFVWPLLVVAAIVGMLFAIGAWIERGPRPTAAKNLLLCAAIAVGGILGGLAGPRHRMERIRDVVAAAAPLTAAIRAYEHDKGRPPRVLDELVPRYLAAVPATGMGGYPTWEYVAPAKTYQGNSWVLLVHTGGPGVNFDQLMYFPNQGYPETGYGGALEKVSDWAYVHE